MRTLVCVVAVFALAVAPALAVIAPGPPGPANVVPVSGKGWGVQIAVSNNSGVPVTNPIWVVLPGPDVLNTTTHAQAQAVANNINLAVNSGYNRLADLSSIGDIDCERLPNGEYSVFVWGTNMFVPGGMNWVKNHLVTVTPSMAKLYGSSMSATANFLTMRLRGMAEMDSMGNGWGDVSASNVKAIKSPWHKVTR